MYSGTIIIVFAIYLSTKKNYTTLDYSTSLYFDLIFCQAGSIVVRHSYMIFVWQMAYVQFTLNPISHQRKEARKQYCGNSDGPQAREEQREDASRYEMERYLLITNCTVISKA